MGAHSGSSRSKSHKPRLIQCELGLLKRYTLSRTIITCLVITHKNSVKEVSPLSNRGVKSGNYYKIRWLWCSITFEWLNLKIAVWSDTLTILDSKFIMLSNNWLSYTHSRSKIYTTEIRVESDIFELCTYYLNVISKCIKYVTCITFTKSNRM